jgi:hypothetical protein
MFRGHVDHLGRGRLVRGPPGVHDQVRQWSTPPQRPAMTQLIHRLWLVPYPAAPASTASSSRWSRRTPPSPSSPPHCIEADAPGSPDGTNHLRTAWIIDPDGSRIELVQWPADPHRRPHSADLRTKSSHAPRHTLRTRARSGRGQDSGIRTPRSVATGLRALRGQPEPSVHEAPTQAARCRRPKPAEGRHIAPESIPYRAGPATNRQQMIKRPIPMTSGPAPDLQ